MADRPTKHRTVAVDVDAIPTPQAETHPWPWYVVAILGTVAVVAAGWLILAGATTLGWLTSPESPLDASLLLASDALLLAHGVPVAVGGQVVTVVPLGLTLVLLVLAQPVAALAARQAAGSVAQSEDTGRIWLNGESVVLRVAGTTAATHGVLIAAVTAALDVQGGIVQGFLGGLVLGAVSGLWGASRGIGFDARKKWPAWLRSVPPAMGYSSLVALAGGLVALVVTLLTHRDRIAFIHEALDPGISGTILLVLLQILYLPNLILWATSWVLGAGVTLGDDSLVSIAVTDVGFLPSIPVLGAVGEPGLGGGALFWWLAVGVAAGLVAALVVGLARPRARFDETALVGGLSGVIAGLLITTLCSLAGGGLGENRLAHIGATTDQLIIVAPALLGLSGLLGGAVLGLVRRPHTEKSGAVMENEVPAEDVQP
ncbi:MAG: cell division protein PerM [Arachnia sp.]